MASKETVQTSSISAVATGVVVQIGNIIADRLSPNPAQPYIDALEVMVAQLGECQSTIELLAGR